MKAFCIWLIIAAFVPILTSFRVGNGQTPTPRLEDTSKERAIALTFASEDCNLPCFWGFVPGTTTTQEAKMMLQETFPEADQFDVKIPSEREGNETNRFSAYEFNLFSQNEMQVFMRLTFQNEYLNHAYLYFPFYEFPVWLPSKTLEPQHIFAEQAQIPKIYIGFYDTSTFGWALILVYDDFGIDYTFQFESGQFTRYSDDPIQLCPNMESNLSIELYLQQPKDLVPIADRMNSSAPSGWLQDNEYYKPVEFVTGLSAEEFVEALLDHPNECIEAYSYNELKSNGQEF